MGSSPVTATTSLFSAAEVHLTKFLRDKHQSRHSSPLVVAFSGGPDSCALLTTAVQLYSPTIAVYAAHLDHGIDPGSSDRAQQARGLAQQIGAEWISDRVTVPSHRPAGVEAWAREQRYSFLERVRSQVAASAVLTGHHLDDQVETVLLRILFGSGIRGLAGIQPWFGPIGRPWLQLPAKLVRQQNADVTWSPIEDPTNTDLSLTRNWVRHRLIPHLTAHNPELPATLSSLAQATAQLRKSTAEALRDTIDARQDPTGKPTISANRLRTLPRVLWPFVLATLDPDESTPGETSPLSGQTSIDELSKQLQRQTTLDVRLSKDRRLVEQDDRLLITDVPSPSMPFCLSCSLPGVVTLPDGGQVEIVAASLEPWMLEGEATRAAFEAPADARVEVRSRIPGDRLQPFGADYQRKIKDILIDAKVAYQDRDRIPLVTINDQPVWIPGITIDHRHRIRGKWPIWVAQWHPGRGN